MIIAEDYRFENLNWAKIEDTVIIPKTKKTSEELWHEYLEAKIKQWKKHNPKEIAKMLRDLRI